MGCHTWYYRPNKIKSLNKHFIRGKCIDMQSKWYFDNLDKDDEYIMELALNAINENIDVDKFLNLSESNPREYNRIVYLLNERVDEEIRKYKSPKYKYSELLDFYLSVECIGNGAVIYGGAPMVYKNRIYSQTGVNGDNVFRLYGYPDKSVRSYKAFRRLIIKSYINGKLPEGDMNCNYGITPKLPTKSEWKRIKRYCKGDFLITFG